MKIRSHFKEYSVDFVGSLGEIADYAKKENTFFVIGHNVYRLYYEFFNSIPKDRLQLIVAEEENKTVNTALDICEKMTAMPSKRNTHLISIGGGITQDITGFVANVLYRGIDWTFYPSTLLAACDSCIGGKTSLNYKGYKNLLGTFFPPDKIKIYPKFFETLEERDYLSGLGEVVKFNVMAGKDGIDLIEEQLSALLKRDSKIIATFVKTSLEFKKTFIEEDEFDKGRRILLNFAHTFGHAFEVSSNYNIPHGTAVALGMVVANYISVSRNLLDSAFASRIENVCKKILPNEFEKNWFDFDTIISAIRKDKKQTSTSIRAVLICDDLSLSIFDDLSIEEIKNSIDYLTYDYLNFKDGD